MGTDPQINHPSHYGGDTPYEAIKVIEAWGLGFALGNAVKYISRAGKKDGNTRLQDLQKAAWYLAREIENEKKILPNSGDGGPHSGGPGFVAWVRDTPGADQS